MRRCLILTHRYLGLGLSGLFVLWFASGIVMLYAGDMPNLAPAVRLARAADLDPARISLSVAEAARRAGLDDPPEAAELVMILDRPAYRFASRQQTRTIFADTGEPLTRLSLEQCRTLASRFTGAPVTAVEHVATIARPDQWTLVDRRMPVHKFRVRDEAGTEVYVAPDLGDITVITTRRMRLLAWLGAIPHWLYFPWLRLNRPLWYQLVVWVSALGCVTTLLGLIVGLLQLRRAPATGGRTWIPYSGWMRWHHLTGLCFGVFALTWVFSGLLSMEPFGWTRASGVRIPAAAFAGGLPDLSAFPPLDRTRWITQLGDRAVKRLDFVRVLGRPFYLVHVAGAGSEQGLSRSDRRPTGRRSAGVERWLVDPGTLAVQREPFEPANLLARLSALLPTAQIMEVERLSAYDAYYDARSRPVAPLPVLRVKLADPAASWVYLDPHLGEVVAVVSRRQRLERWLYRGLHSLDFALPYDSAGRRALVLALSLGGLATSGLGGWVGAKRLVRFLARRRA